MENLSICSKCKGACCKLSSGHLFPEDLGFEINLENLKNLFNSGNYSIDWWGSHPNDKSPNSSRLYYPRYKHRGIEKLLDNSRYLPCIMLSDEGCKLPHDNRPTVCRELIPRADFRCTFPDNSLSTESCAIAWQKYQNLFLSIISEKDII